jgi:hypothetical protein
MDINNLVVPLAISLLIGGLIIFYFSRRFVELDKKTTAMLQVIQALSRDNEQRKMLDNYTRGQIMREQQGGSQEQSLSQDTETEQIEQGRSDLINVSDNGNPSDNDSDSDSVDDSESSDEESGYEESDNEQMSKPVNYHDKLLNGITVGSELNKQSGPDLQDVQDLTETVKVIDMNQEEEYYEEEIEVEVESDDEVDEVESGVDEDEVESGDEDDEVESSDEDDEDEVESGDEDDEVEIEELAIDGINEEKFVISKLTVSPDEELESENLEISKLDESDIKNSFIENMMESISNNEQESKEDSKEDSKEKSEEDSKEEKSDKNVGVMNYKKTPVKELREIVKQKGLMSDPSKVKKAELLKLLSVE